MLNIFGVVIFLRTGWVVVCVFLFIYMFVYLLVFYFFLMHACSWYRCKSFALSIKWSDLKSFVVFAFLNFSNEQLCEERERFCKASLLFFYYYFILILFHVFMYIAQSEVYACMQTVKLILILHLLLNFALLILFNFLYSLLSIMLQINLISAESVFKSASYSAGLKKTLNNFCSHILLALHRATSCLLSVLIF